MRIDRNTGTSWHRPIRDKKREFTRASCGCQTSVGQYTFPNSICKRANRQMAGSNQRPPTFQWGTQTSGTFRARPAWVSPAQFAADPKYGDVLHGSHECVGTPQDTGPGTDTHHRARRVNREKPSIVLCSCCCRHAHSIHLCGFVFAAPNVLVAWLLSCLRCRQMAH